MSKNSALQYKEQGNAAFKAGDFPAAIDHYTAAILSDSSDATFLLNRAAAYLKLGKNEDAERDSSDALKLDSKNPKAWFRRARARVCLGKLSDAQIDLHSLLRIEPENHDAKEELRRVQDSLSQKHSHRMLSTVSETLPTSSSFIPKSLVRRRVPIRVVNQLQTQQTHGPEAVSDSTRPTPPDDEASTPELPMKKARGGIFRSSGRHTVFPSLSKNMQTSSIATPITALMLPPTFAVFQDTWSSLSSSDDRWKYLQHVSPATLPLLLQNSLEPTVVISLLRTFQDVLSSPTVDVETRKGVLKYMKALPHTARWRTVTQLLDDDEKEVVKEMWRLLADCEVDAQILSEWNLDLE